MTNSETVAKAAGEEFQYRKRYEITCDFHEAICVDSVYGSFNTASGMRSHVTARGLPPRARFFGFNTASGMRSHVTQEVQAHQMQQAARFNTASGMRSHVTQVHPPGSLHLGFVSIPQAV